MRVWRSLRTRISRRQDAARWERWWKERLSGGTGDMFPLLPSPLVRYRGGFYDLANRDDLLVAIMAACGLRTVLCAGSGISQEPRALAEAGFHVVALDVSPTAMRVAKDFEGDPRRVNYFCGPKAHRPSGRVDFVVGDLFHTTACLGPFDVIIERRTVQRLPDHQRSAGLEALAARLGKVGIFLSHCDDDQYPPDLGWSFHHTGLFHASESWFREQGWTIWDGAPSLPLTGRVAWLIRSGSMKPRPSNKGDGLERQGGS
jgi:hypothetical protein